MDITVFAGPLSNARIIVQKVAHGGPQQDAYLLDLFPGGILTNPPVGWTGPGGHAVSTVRVSDQMIRVLPNGSVEPSRERVLVHSHLITHASHPPRWVLSIAFLADTHDPTRVNYTPGEFHLGVYGLPWSPHGLIPNDLEWIDNNRVRFKPTWDGLSDTRARGFWFEVFLPGSVGGSGLPPWALPAGFFGLEATEIDFAFGGSAVATGVPAPWNAFLASPPPGPYALWNDNPDAGASSQQGRFGCFANLQAQLGDVYAVGVAQNKALWDEGQRAQWANLAILAPSELVGIFTWGGIQYDPRHSWLPHRIGRAQIYNKGPAVATGYNHSHRITDLVQIAYQTRDPLLQELSFELFVNTEALLQDGLLARDERSHRGMGRIASLVFRIWRALDDGNHVAEAGRVRQWIIDWLAYLDTDWGAVNYKDWGIQGFLPGEDVLDNWWVGQLAVGFGAIAIFFDDATTRARAKSIVAATQEAYLLSWQGTSATDYKMPRFSSLSNLGVGSANLHRNHDGLVAWGYAMAALTGLNGGTHEAVRVIVRDAIQLEFPMESYQGGRWFIAETAVP